ncbi:MAG TPA: ribosome biogenesis GTP-binding protein YihA/YsxC [Ignavibacteriaceae bacterium]|nr:ribosome biogenesis GTP-binding protein YihA/YsxC [Ignavibacteriaceae bacterium]
MFQTQQFIKSVYSLKELPDEKLPVIILCGRSNVGKSSLINSFFNRKDLAKTSSTPGKTRSINYYKIDNSFYFVDLPGYGYAKVGKKERGYWGKLIDEYLSFSKDIILAVHLVDSKIGPTELDILLKNLLAELRIPSVILLTKIDKLSRSAQKAAIGKMLERFPGLILGDSLLIYSALKGTGKKEFAKKIVSLFGRRSNNL